MQSQVSQQAVQNWLEANVMNSSDWALLGFVAAIISILVIGFFLIGLFLEVISWMRQALRTRSIKNDDIPGYSILVSSPRGRSGKFFGKRIFGALREHLPVFTFGVQFRLDPVSRITGGLSPNAIARARTRLEQTDADLILWGHRTGKGAADLVLFGLSRAGGLRADEARLFNIECSGDKKDWTNVYDSSVAYSVAKALQPGLTSPEAFRTEKLKTVVDALEDILSANINLTPTRQAEFEADFCATSVHIGESEADSQTLGRVIDLRRAHLERPDGEFSPARKTQARLDLGRALLAQAEQSYDSSVLEEAVSHLSKVVEALRADPQILRAQTASDAMYKAQSLVENRKRFSLNFGSQG